MGWRTLSSETLLRDRWIDLRADRCLTPSGVEISPYYVLRYPDWVHVVALTPGGELVLVRQYRHGAGQEMLELPAGGVETGEPDAGAAARRELAEETGYTSERWSHVASLHANPATQTNQVHTFLALDAVPSGTPQLDPGEEGLAVTVLPLDTVLSGLRDGVLGQSMQVASLLLATETIRR